MKIRTKIGLAVDMLLQRPGTYALSVIMLTLCIALVGTICYVAADAGGYGRRLEKGLRTEAECVGYLNITEYEDEELWEFWRRAMEQGLVAGYGTAQERDVSSREELRALADVQVELGMTADIAWYEEGLFLSNSYTAGLWDMYNWNLEEGKPPMEYEEFTKQENSVLTELVYVGKAYEDKVTVGERYEHYSKKGELISVLVIAGVFAEDSYAMESDVAIRDMASGNGFIDQTDQVVYVLKDEWLLSGRCFFYIDASADMAVTTEGLKNLAEEMGLTVRTHTLEGMIRAQKRFSSTLVNGMLELSLLLFVGVAVLVVCSQSIAILTRAEEFGTWLVCGATMKDLGAVLVYQNAIRLVLSSCIGSMLTVFICHALCGTIGTEGRLFANELLCFPVLPLAIAAGVVLTLIVSVCTLTVFCRQSAINLVKGL